MYMFTLHIINGENMIVYYKKMNYITSIGPETHSQTEILPEW